MSQGRWVEETTRAVSSGPTLGAAAVVGAKRWFAVDDDDRICGTVDGGGQVFSANVTGNGVMDWAQFINEAAAKRWIEGRLGHLSFLGQNTTWVYKVAP